MGAVDFYCVWRDWSGAGKRASIGILAGREECDYAGEQDLLFIGKDGGRQSAFQSRETMGVLQYSQMKAQILMVWALLSCATLAALFNPLPTVQLQPHCFNSAQNGECLECKFGFTLRQGACVEGHRNCKTFDPAAGVCQSCFVGYRLTEQFACEADAAAATGEGCSAESEGRCVECKEGFYFNWEGRCEPIEPQCLSFNHATSTCQACEPPFFYSFPHGRCMPRRWEFDYRCTSYIANSTCLSCLNGYYLLGKCQRANPSCRTHEAADPARCRSCFQGFVLSGSNCLPASDNPLCQSYDSNGTCTQCLFNAFLNSVGVCVVASPTCATHDSNGRCLTCLPGHSLSAGACLPTRRLRADPVCRLWAGEQCLVCGPWSFLNREGQCEAASNICRTYFEDSGKCASCYGGWRLTNLGNCLPVASSPCRSFLPDGTCEACTVSTYSPQVGVCEVDFEPCLRRDRFGKCSMCDRYHFVVGGACVAIDPNCASFDHGRKVCVECFWLLRPHGNSCVDPAAQ